jgi:uncharacterized phiE125 gp8 family phage protein
MALSIFPAVHDPSDVADYAVDFSDLSGNLASCTVTLDAAAIAAGVALGAGEKAARVDGPLAIFWLSTSNPANSLFVAGLTVTVTVTVVTQDTVARTFQRSVQIVVQETDTNDLKPVTLAEVKEFLRVQDNLEDATITALIGTAKNWVEEYTGQRLSRGSLLLEYPAFSDKVVLSVSPLVTVDSVEYDDTEGAVQALAAWRVRTFAGMPSLVPAIGERFPGTEHIPGAVRVQVTAGYASNDDIPDAIKHAALLLISNWYDNRHADTMGNMGTLPHGVAGLLAPYRQWFVK